ncbi:MAG: hypothetical protein HYZ72_18575 [Deltaproteobacteria bacterium]|nr:hypothetical protein [Deltaproteobacteria bacterium]
MHGHCEELPLGFLTAEHVAEYLAVRFPGGAQQAAPLRKLARLIHQRTDGNPLFMVNLVDYLLARGVLAQVDGQWELQAEPEEVAVEVPERLQQMIERQIERLGVQERRMLEVASVVGAEFSATAVAAGLKTGAEEVEEQCEALARRGQFLRASETSEWPDGTVAARYSFLHALYREVLYERVPVGRRQRLHRQIGERAEAAYGSGRERSQPNWLCTSSVGGSTAVPCSICSKRERMPSSGVPIRKRPASSPRGWSGSRLCQTPLNGSGKNSRCKSPWALHCLPPRVMRPQK